MHLIPAQVGSTEVGVADGLDLGHPVALLEAGKGE